MSNNIYQIHVQLKWIQPKIWRRIHVAPDTSLIDLHKILQTSMGWKNSHLHIFFDGQKEYAPGEFQLPSSTDSIQVQLESLLKKEGDRLNYEYDFGDGWLHTILLEKILPAESESQVPKCVDGKQNCPPEDCGGPGGYQEMVQILEQPDHEEYQNYIRWLGKRFDPDAFDKDAINKLLKQKDYGCIWLR